MIQRLKQKVYELLRHSERYTKTDMVCFTVQQWTRVSRSRYNSFMLYFILLFLTIVPLDVFAYLDPGTGSLLFQFFLAIFVGASYALKVYWQKVKLFFARFSLRQKKVSTEEERDES